MNIDYKQMRINITVKNITLVCYTNYIRNIVQLNPKMNA